MGIFSDPECRVSVDELNNDQVEPESIDDGDYADFYEDVEQD